jgi:hypothetical protein
MPAGVADEQLVDAVRQSGYPLQTIVASQLRETFSIQEEWSYVDRDSGDLRTVDVFAERPLYALEGEHPRVRPHIAIVAECKRSDLPFLFFETAGRVWLSEFPLVAGLREPYIRLTTDTDLSTLSLPVITCLGLQRHPFVSSAPAVCATLSKLVRAGRDLLLSGSEAYASIVLPLVKAMDYFARTVMPLPTHVYFDCYAAVGICVLNAPMVVVRSSSDPPALRLAPWARLVRDEARKDGTQYERSATFVVDFVHRDYLATYIRDWLTPFCRDFGEKVIKHALVLAACAGFVPGMWEAGFDRVEASLRPIRVADNATRAAAIGGRVATQLRHLFVKLWKLLSGRRAP